MTFHPSINEKFDTKDPYFHASHTRCFDTSVINFLTPNSFFEGEVINKKVNDFIEVTKDYGVTEFAEVTAKVTEDVICIIFFDSTDGVVYEGKNLSKNQFHICSDKDIRFIGKNFVSGFSITIDKEYFFKYVIDNTSIRFQSFDVIDHYVEISNDSYLKISASINEVISSDVFEPNEFLNVLKEILNYRYSKLTDCKVRKRHLIVEKGTRLVNENYSDMDFNIDCLCSQMHTTRRTVQYAFNEVMGIAPLLYLRYLRLNSVRNIMLYDDSISEKTINEIAIDNGFSHIGRFSKYYFEFFGELPSETLSKRKK